MARSHHNPWRPASPPREHTPPHSFASLNAAHVQGVLRGVRQVNHPQTCPPFLRFGLAHHPPCPEPPKGWAFSPCFTWCNCHIVELASPPLLEQDLQAEFDSRPDMDGAARSGACVPRPLRSSIRARSSHRYTCMLQRHVDDNVMAGRWRGVFGAHGRDATLYGAERHPMPSRSPRERRLQG